MARNRPRKSYLKHKPKPYQEELAKHVPKKRQLFRKVGNETTEVTEEVVKLRMFAISWGFPFDEISYSLWTINTLRLGMMPWDEVSTSRSTYLPTARNMIHDNFLEHSETPWLVMLDSDVLPPPDFLDRLLSHDKPFVGGWYRMKGGMEYPVVYDDNGKVDPENGHPLYNPRHEAGTGLEAVSALGAGCLSMHRDVAEAIGRSPYNLEGGGEDLALCRAIDAAEYEVLVDWSVACAHLGVGFT